ncbi:hypothetical protein DO72_3845 [Burkholderia pseudomallei]|nr:hypothetical protein DO72_3845 [Burkholderia pseudomallei]
MRHRRGRQGVCPFPRRYRLATWQASHSGYLDGEPLWPATQWLTLPQCPGCFDAGHFRYMSPSTPSRPTALGHCLALAFRMLP